MSPYEIVGRYYSQFNPEHFKEIELDYTGILKNPKYVPQIQKAIFDNYQEESDKSKNELFVATCYQLYAPLSYLRKKQDKKAIAKLPVGVRDEIQKCLGCNNPESVNSEKGYVESYMRPFNNGVTPPFKKKVMDVVETFKCYSNNPCFTQFNLFS